MSRESSFPLTHPDGRRIVATWTPGEGGRGTVVLIHGLAEHRKTYGKIVETLCATGLGCVRFDLRGHGEAEGKPGHVEGFADYLADVDLALGVARDRSPGAPIFLLGHSLGGLIACHVALRHGSEIRGLILCSPAIGFAREPGVLLAWVARRLNRWAPRFALGSGIDLADLTRNADAVARAREDPKRFRRITMRWFAECRAAQDEIVARAAELQTAALVLVAGADVVVRPEATQALFETMGSEDREIGWYPEHYHELLREPDREEILERIRDWMDARVSKAAT